MHSVVVDPIAGWLALPEHADATLREMLEYIESVLHKAPGKSSLASWLDAELILLTKSRGNDVGGVYENNG